MAEQELLERPAETAAPAPAPAAPAAAPASAAAPEAPAADWPADWRTRVAAKPEQMKTLDRFASPKALFESYEALRLKLNNGELRAPLPDNPTTEQLSKWRKDNGVPEAADKYDLSALKVDDVFKPQVEAFLKQAHEQNLPQDKALQLIQGRLAAAKELETQIQARDEKTRQTAEETLISEWGGEYTRNRNQIRALLDTMPAGVAQRLLGGRLAPKDGEMIGTPVGDDIDVQRWLIGLARQINPVATVVPAGNGNVEGAIEDEVGKLQKMMGDRGSEYWKGANAEKNQARYRELVDAQQRMKR